MLSECGWVFYDGGCPFCSWVAARATLIFEPRGFCFVRLQTPWVADLLDLDPRGPFEELKLITAEGKVVGGAEAVVYLAGAAWWGLPLAIAGRIPILRELVRVAYGWISSHRHCISGTCGRTH